MRTLSPLELIHSEIYGPMNVKARHEAIYFITLVDDYRQHGTCTYYSHRYEALDAF